MPLLTDRTIRTERERTYHVHVPANPMSDAVPAIVVFHGGGQDVTTIAGHWGIDPPNPVPSDVADYLLVFPLADPVITHEWIHYRNDDVGFPEHDLRFVEQLVHEIATTSYPTGSGTVAEVRADPDHLYAAGFSNGGGMVWQLVNSRLVELFRGFAVVGRALDPEKAAHYRRHAVDDGRPLVATPVMYVHGTADPGFRSPSTLKEVPIDGTLPAFTVREMLDRNAVPSGPATTALVPGGTDLTEAVVQVFRGTEAFAMATVLNGGHNWPSATTVGNPPVATHFDATHAILEFWRSFADLAP